MDGDFKPQESGFLNDAFQKLHDLILADRTRPVAYVSQLRNIVNELINFFSELKLDKTGSLSIPLQSGLRTLRLFLSMSHPSYAEVQHDLMEHLIVELGFAREQQENGLTAWDISGKKYRKEAFLTVMNETMC